MAPWTHFASVMAKRFATITEQSCVYVNGRTILYRGTFQQDLHTFQGDILECIQHVTVLEWLALSPLLLPIKYLLDNIGHGLFQGPQQQNLHKQESALLREWRKIPQATIPKVISSM